MGYNQLRYQHLPSLNSWRSPYQVELRPEDTRQARVIGNELLNKLRVCLQTNKVVLNKLKKVCKGSLLSCKEQQKPRSPSTAVTVINLTLGKKSKKSATVKHGFTCAARMPIILFFSYISSCLFSKRI